MNGNVNERVAVCDEDKPLITSTIRREVPAMNDFEFEKLDELSNGKLRHYLVGSPSGYSWNEQVETILSFEATWKEWDNIYVDTKMLPKSRQHRLSLEQKTEDIEQKQIEDSQQKRIEH